MADESPELEPAGSPEAEREQARELVKNALASNKNAPASKEQGGKEAERASTPPHAAAEELVRSLLARHGNVKLRARQATFRPSDAEELARNASAIRVANIKIEHRRRTIELRRRVANWAIAFVFIQIVASNFFFFLYLSGNLYSVDPMIMVAWMSSSVIEIIGIMGIVAISLFPNRNGRKGAKGGKDPQPSE